MSDIGSSTCDYLAKQSEILLKNIFMKYENYTKHQERLRLQLIKTNEEYKYLRSCLEKANEDWLTMKSNQSHAKIYQMLFGNNFVEEFTEGNRERLQLKFFKIMIHCKNLKTSLGAVQRDVSSLKTGYEELFQRRKILSKGSSYKKTLEYEKRQASLQLKSVEVMCECERLDKCLSEACEEMLKLNTEHDALTRRYQIFSRDTIFKEFLIKIIPKVESVENQKKCNCSKSSRKCLNILEKTLSAEQQRSSCLDDFSEKLCSLLFKFLSRQFSTNNRSIGSLIQSDVKTKSGFFSTVILETSSSELKKRDEALIVREIIEDEDEFRLHIPCTDDEDDDSAGKDGLAEKRDTNQIEMQDSMVQNEPSNSSDQNKSFQMIIDEPLSAIEVSIDSIAPTKNHNFENETSANENFVDSIGTTPTVVTFQKTLNFSETQAANSSCDDCDKNYSIRGSLNSHRRMEHQSIGPFKCGICGQTYDSKNSLNAHKLVHHYKCSICLRIYKSPPELIHHLRHGHARATCRKKIGSYCCAHCDERFFRKQALFHHICSKHFSKLLQHFECAECSMIFTTKSKLNKHLKTNHSSTSVTSF